MLRPKNGSRQRRTGGFTLVELLAAMVVFGVLMTFGMNQYRRLTAEAKVSQSIMEIMELQAVIDEHLMTRGSPPPSLADVGRDGVRDPWGTPYEYVPFTDDVPNDARKDAFLVPINTSYDLYSRGADGLTKKQLSAKVSLDDVVRANDGAFVGLARDY